jgi:hypothetical protein
MKGDTFVGLCSRGQPLTLSWDVIYEGIVMHMSM